jgi:hypothetical protein
MSYEERSVICEVTVSGLLNNKVCMYMCPTPKGFRDSVISMYSSKIFDMKEIFRTFFIYCSSDKVGTPVIINALCN